MIFLDKINKKGFTLIELIIVILIIGIMSTLIFINYSEFNKTFALERSANQTAQEIRKVLEKSMSSEIQEEITGNDFKGGFGVFLEEGKKEYIIFADINNNGRYTSGSDEILETINFELGVKIKNVNLKACQGSSSFRSIVFLPPNPDVFIGGRVGEKSNCNEMEIILTHEYLNDERKITVNRGGLIELE